MNIQLLSRKFDNLLRVTKISPLNSSRQARYFSLDQEPGAKVRVRFAPSPTGHIHLGGLRTALYNYIFARQHDGQFILRIEDTDRARLVPGAADEIENVLEWAGLRPDESPRLGGRYGPYSQSERLSLYQQHAQVLLESGKAYRCFCSPTRLDLLRKYQARNREKIRYDGKCKNLQPSEVEEKLASRDNCHVIRFALTPGVDQFDDLVFGPIRNNLVEALDSDPVILKSDTYPTYHFANVIDDQFMKITHVLRGSEWISSTAKHIQLYHAFDWQEPKYIHIPLITMKDGSKMSKRNDDSRVNSYIDAGYQPSTLFNFLTNTGGGIPKSKQDSMEFWTLDELIKGFNFNAITCHPGSIDMNRLTVYSAKELQQTWQQDPDKVMARIKDSLQRMDIAADIEESLARSITGQLIQRLNAVNDLLSPDYIYIWRRPDLNWDKQKYLEDGVDLKSIVIDFIAFVESTGIQNKDKFIEGMKELSCRHKLGYSPFMKLLRLLLTNRDTGLPIFEICNCLGQARLMEYLKSGLKFVST